MNLFRALAIALSLGIVAPIGLVGLALPVYAQEDDDWDSDDSETDDAEAGEPGDVTPEAANTENANPEAGNQETDGTGAQSVTNEEDKPAIDFKDLDVGAPSPNQTLSIYGTPGTTK